MRLDTVPQQAYVEHLRSIAQRRRDVTEDVGFDAVVIARGLIPEHAGVAGLAALLAAAGLSGGQARARGRRKRAEEVAAAREERASVLQLPPADAAVVVERRRRRGRGRVHGSRLPEDSTRGAI